MLQYAPFTRVTALPLSRKRRILQHAPDLSVKRYEIREVENIFFIVGIIFPLIPKLVDYLWWLGKIIYSSRLKEYLLKNSEAKKSHSDPYLMDDADYHNEWHRYFSENEHLQIKDKSLLSLGKRLSWWIAHKGKIYGATFAIGGSFIVAHLIASGRA